MTRLNLIISEELSDQHLLAEYRELPRIIKNEISLTNAPDKYCLGKGHLKFARKHLFFTLHRYNIICQEMKYRGFRVNFPYDEMQKYLLANGYTQNADFLEKNGVIYTDYIPSEEDIAISRQRLADKIGQKPNWYKWTKRERPK